MELLYGNSLQGRIRKFIAGSVSVNKTSFFAENLAAVLSSCSESAVLALRLNIVSEVFLLCHINIPFCVARYIFFILYHIFSGLAIFFCDNIKIVIINKIIESIGEKSPNLISLLTGAFTAITLTV